jgi:hypothetical protein
MVEAGEEKLRGGNLSAVVRIGETVRRPAGPWTPAVHALLAHLEHEGFDAAPRAHGLDEAGREILTYLEGETVADAVPWPSWCWSSDTLLQLARMLRDYHDTARSFVPPRDARWRLAVDALEPGQVICHNDVAPYNLVRRPDGALALIDWDVAGPGDPLDDLAFAARAFAPLHPDDECRRLGFEKLDERPRRLRELLDGYGLEDRDGFVERVERRLETSIDRITQAAEAGESAFAQLIANGLLDPVHRSLTWINENRAALEATLAR